MKLLLDQNISFKIIKGISDNFPGSKHISDLHLQNSSDVDLWNYAKVNEFTIVTFDSDFIDLSLLLGFPSKIIWLRTGNTSTNNLIELLSRKNSIIQDFIIDNDSSFLELE
jgi:predicted nuclease of predicted toxin-antitoxin system